MSMADDDFDWDLEPEDREVRCKYCGQRHLCWVNRKLVDMDDGTPHTCITARKVDLKDFPIT